MHIKQPCKQTRCDIISASEDTVYNCQLALYKWTYLFMCIVLRLTDKLQSRHCVFLPPFCFMKLTTCCCPVSCKACRNLTHWSSDVSRSSKASFLSYTVSLWRTLFSCLWFRTRSLRRWSRSPKSGSTKSTSEDLSRVMADKTPVLSPARIAT